MEGRFLFLDAEHYIGNYISIGALKDFKMTLSFAKIMRFVKFYVKPQKTPMFYTFGFTANFVASPPPTSDTCDSPKLPLSPLSPDSSSSNYQSFFLSKTNRHLLGAVARNSFYMNTYDANSFEITLNSIVHLCQIIAKAASDPQLKIMADKAIGNLALQAIRNTIFKVNLLNLIKKSTLSPTIIQVMNQILGKSLVEKNSSLILPKIIPAAYDPR